MFDRRLLNSNEISRSSRCFYMTGLFCVPTIIRYGLSAGHLGLHSRTLALEVFSLLLALEV